MYFRTPPMENHWGWRGFGFLPSFQILIETRPGRHCWWLCILRRLTFLLLTKNGTGYVEANGAHEKHDRQIMKIHLFPIPKQSMYGIFTHVSNKNKPNVGEYAVHGEILESPFPYGKTPWKCNRASRGFFLSIVSWFLADIIQINIFKSDWVNLNGTCDTFNTCFTCLMFFAGSHPVSNFRRRACSLYSTWFSCLSCMEGKPAAGGRWRFKTWGSPGHHFFLETIDFDSRW